jgi:hypothetical protein
MQSNAKTIASDALPKSWIFIPCALGRLDGEERDRAGKPLQFCALELLEAIRPILSCGQADYARLREHLIRVRTACQARGESEAPTSWPTSGAGSLRVPTPVNDTGRIGP